MDKKQRYSYGAIYTKYLLDKLGHEEFLGVLKDPQKVFKIWQQGDEERAVENLKEYKEGKTAAQ